MDMLSVVQTYFEVDSRSDVAGLSDVFFLDAVVEDEGAQHHGWAAIQEWWTDAKQKTSYVVEPIGSTFDSGVIIVRANVSGAFPGSPILLNYAFTVADGKIARLEIRP